MAIHYRCPKCQTQDSAGDDLAGTQIRCKQCGALLQLPGTRASSPHVMETPGVPPPPLPSVEPRAERRREEEDYDDDYPRRRRDRDDEYGLSRGEPPAGWSTVRTGLGMMFWSLIAIISEAVLVIIALVATAGFAAGGAIRGQFRGRPDDAFAVLLIIGGCSLLITLLIYFIGQCLTCAAPQHSGARGYALGSVICISLAIVLGVLSNLLTQGMRQGGNPMLFMPQRDLGVGLVLGLVNLGLSVTGIILFLVFIKTVARYFGDEGVARGANGFLILYAIFMVLYVAFIAVILAIAARPGFGPRDDEIGPIFLVGGCVLMAMILALLVWFLVLLAQTRGVIARGLARPGY